MKWIVMDSYEQQAFITFKIFIQFIGPLETSPGLLSLEAVHEHPGSPTFGPGVGEIDK